MQTPLAIFLYRRPALVRDLLARIRGNQPAKLWLIADGPKNDGEADDCRQTRQTAEQSVDWNCEVVRVYSETNLGLRNRLESGLNALFSRERSAIVLEEDCHPTADFFPFCEQMLGRYQNESRVGGISGNCFLPAEAAVPGDYFFSRYLHVWGWATWARAWNAYGQANWTWPEAGFHHFFAAAKREESRYWDRIFKRLARGELNSWAYRWASWFWAKGWVAITPSQNLVRNQGFGAGATHTWDSSVETGIARHGRLPPPYRGPTTIQADEALDEMVFANHFLRTEGRRSAWQKIRDRLLGKRGRVAGK